MNTCEPHMWLQDARICCIRQEMSAEAEAVSHHALLCSSKSTDQDHLITWMPSPPVGSLIILNKYFSFLFSSSVL